MLADDEEKQLRAVALQNATSILQARKRAEQELLRTKEALEEETRILELLNDTGTLLASTLDIEALVQAVTDAATRLSGAEFGAFFHTKQEESGGVFTLYTLSGAPREAFAKFDHPRATPIFAPTFNGEGVIRIGDVKKDARFGQWAPYHGMPPGHLPVTSYLAVPVKARQGEVIGGLFFGHSSPDVFTERSERLVVAIAAQAGVALDNARLFENARRAADDRASSLDAERAARTELERISVIKDEFLATLSHELRTPLNAILGWSTILLSREQPGSDSRGPLETIVRNARAQAQLIDDLLDMQRIVSGKIRLDVQPLELASLVEAAVDSVRPSVEAKGIVVRKTIDPNAGPVFGDPNRVQQVVWNLLTNAVKFTPKAGKIDVMLQRVNSYVEITVHDSGMGIDADFLPQVFQRFWQADSSSTRKQGGLGLGLSIVKHLVELHGGTVKAESAGLGHGSTFTIALPIRAIRDVIDPSREHPTSRRGGSDATLGVSLVGITVLVVDDEPDARGLVSRLLGDVGATVVTAASAAEGLALVESRRPDLIVSDIGMPAHDGHQFMRDVRALSAARGGLTPSIALTAFARSEDRTRAMLSGYQVHISKPVEPPELVAAIQSLVMNTRR